MPRLPTETKIMKKLTDPQLSKLRARCLRAASRNYDIGEIRQYLKDLAEETEMMDPPQGARRGSVAHLQGLIQEALDQRSGKKPKPVKPVKLEDIEIDDLIAGDLDVLEPVKVVEEVKEEKPVEEKVTGLEARRASKANKKPYEGWSQDKLYREARVRNISGRSTMSKEELIQALRDSADPV